MSPISFILFQETFDGTHPALIRRSIFGLTRAYNKLPQYTVSSITSMYTERTGAELEPLSGG